MYYCTASCHTIHSLYSKYHVPEMARFVWNGHYAALIKGACIQQQT